MSRMVFPALLGALLVLTTPAFAHAPLMGIGGVTGGVLHALLVPEHGMSLVALGLVMGRQEPGARRSGELIFMAALTVGLIAATLIVAETVAGDVLLVATGILGLLVAAAWAPPFLGWPLAAIAGLALALDSIPEATSTNEVTRMLIGSGIGAVIALAIVAEGSVHLKGKAPGIATRVLGSWIAAISIMVVALRIVTRMTIG